MVIKVGDIYLLDHSGFAARVIEPPQGGALAPPGQPFLVESLLVRARWYVNERGEPHPADGDTPKLRLDAKVTTKGLAKAAGVFLVFGVGLTLAFWIDSIVSARAH